MGLHGHDRPAEGGLTARRPRPIILCAGDSAGMLAQLRSELGRRYRADFEVVGCRTPGRALATLDRALAERVEVALVLADHRMPGTSGLDVLERARARHRSVARAHGRGLERAVVGISRETAR